MNRDNMDNNKALQNLLNGTASEEEIKLLKHGLASGEISIGGNVNQSVIIIGSGNTVELPPSALDALGARSLLGDLDRDLTGDEIAAGLNRLETELPLRAPILLIQFKEQARRLRPSLKTNIKSLSDQARKECVEALAQINGLCMEVLDISFNALCLGENPPEYDSRSPFRGLESFRPEDSEFFFGRETLTKKLAGRINSHPFLAVLGASGSGKSSLVMAGLIPALGLEYLTFRPGTNPLEALEAVKENTLVVVDQFEELFTLTREEAVREEFITKLLETTKRNKVIITLRSDFLGEVGIYHLLKEEIQSHLEIIPPMNLDELRRAMEGQAGVVGFRFEADLSQQILDDVEGEPGAMPLLQHALWELWNRRHGCNLRASEYRAFGGVKKAITSTAEKIYEDCNKDEQEQMRDIFLRLTRLDENDEGRDTRRRVEINDLIPSGRDTTAIALLLEKLTNERLIVKTIHDDKTELEVAHEALIRHWDRLRNWLDEDREHLRLREGVSEDAKKWERSEKKETFLNHRGGRLEDAQSLEENPRYRLTGNEQAYLKACISRRNKEQREREHRLRWTVIASVTAAIIFLVLGSFGLVKSNEASLRAYEAATAQVKAETQARIARAGELSVQSDHLYDKKFQISLLLGIKAYQTEVTVQTFGTLLDNVQAYPQLRALLTKQTLPISSVAFSPDGQTLASGSSDGTIMFWDVATRQPIGQPLSAHTNWVTSVAFSPDGKILASGSGDDSIILWNVATRQPIGQPLTGHTGWVNSVAFSPDGKTLASGSDDYSIILWNVVAHQPIGQPLIGHTKSVNSVAFSPDGKTLASGSEDNSVILWDVSTHQPVGLRLTEHTKSVNSVAFSPDGKTLASGSYDRTIILWDVATHESIGQSLSGHTEFVNSVVFSPDGKILASGSVDNSIILWDVATHQPIGEPLIGHTKSVNSVVFSPDGKTLASGGWDLSIILWNVDTRRPISLSLTGHTALVNSVVFSPDGQTLASGSGNDDNTILLWDVVTHQPIGQPLTGHTASVNSVAFSPDGKILASGSDDHSIILWDVATHQPIGQSLTGHAEPVNSVAFSPDGKILASGSVDNSIILWDVATHQPIEQPLTGHTESVNSVAFSPDGRILASGSWDESIILWDVAAHRPIGQPLKGHTEAVYSIAFSPDGKTLASASLRATINLSFNNAVILWDVATHKPIGQPLTGQTDSILSVAFSPDGKFLASSSVDNSIILWDVATRHPIGQPLTGHTDAVRSVAFSPNGKTLASGSNDRSIILWSMDSQSWIEQSCQRASRNLTLAEWEIYVGDAESYQAVCSNLPLDLEYFKVIAKSVLSNFNNPNQVKNAIDKVRSALLIDSTIKDTSAESFKIVSEVVVEQISEEIAAENIENALNLFRQARQVQIQISTNDKNIIYKAIAEAVLSKPNDPSNVKTAFNEVKAALIIDGVAKDPNVEALGIVSTAIVEQISAEVDAGNIEKALELFTQAKQIHAQISINDANVLNDLCWFGSLQGYAKRVIQYCDQAVQLAPEEGYIRDSRGLARGLIGDYEGATSDFQYFVDENIKNGDEQEDDVKNRQQWIIDLKAGRNPFTPEVLESLKNE